MFLWIETWVCMDICMCTFTYKCWVIQQHRSQCRPVYHSPAFSSGQLFLQNRGNRIMPGWWALTEWRSALHGHGRQGVAALSVLPSSSTQSWGWLVHPTGVELRSLGLYSLQDSAALSMGAHFSLTTNHMFLNCSRIVPKTPSFGVFLPYFSEFKAW